MNQDQAEMVDRLSREYGKILALAAYNFSGAKMKAETARGAFVFDAKKVNGVGLFAGGLTVLLALMVGVPLLMVVLMSLRTGFPGEGGPLTLGEFHAVYSSPGTYKVLPTLLFASGTVLVTIAFAVPLVWLLMRTDLPLKGTIYVLMTVGILIPVFLRTIAWICCSARAWSGEPVGHSVVRSRSSGDRSL